MISYDVQRALDDKVPKWEYHMLQGKVGGLENKIKALEDRLSSLENKEANTAANLVRLIEMFTELPDNPFGEVEESILYDIKNSIY
jgi:hypothetical protein